jgi:hypothetical protein
MCEVQAMAKMTIPQLLRYLHQRILDELAKGNEEELNYLSTTTRVIFEAAESHGDDDLYSLLDDLNYLLNETLMGAQGKGERALSTIATKLQKLEER